MCQLFAWGGQSIGVSASPSVLPMNTQAWSPLGWTGWISLQSKGLSRVFSNTTVQNHQFFGAQLSSQSNSHIHAWPLEKPYNFLHILSSMCTHYIAKEIYYIMTFKKSYNIVHLFFISAKKGQCFLKVNCFIICLTMDLEAVSQFRASQVVQW